MKKKVHLKDIAARVHRNPSSISRQLTKAGIVHRRGEIDGAVAEKIMADAALRDNKTIANDSGTPAYKYKMLQCKRLVQEIQRVEGKSVDIDEHVAKMVGLAEIMRDVLAQMVSQTRVETGDPRLVVLQEKARSECFKRANALLVKDGINGLHPA